MESERAVPQLYYKGEPLDMSSQCFGELNVSTDALDDCDEYAGG